MSGKNFIKIFSEISSSDNFIAGGKGASLGEMARNGIPVPSGFVILSEAFNEFLKETDINVEIDAILRKIDVKKVHTIENVSEEIQALIMSKKMPSGIKKEIVANFKKLRTEFVAVRSSATSEDSAQAAWAGQLDSFLNTTEKNLLDNVKKCWASLFTPRAIFYRFEQKLHKTEISVAVVVQKMIQSEKSGIAFSVHPVTEDPNQLIIEAGYGLGEAIVSGQITPDSYVVAKSKIKNQKSKSGEAILDINVNEQKKALYKKSQGGNEWLELGEKGKKQVLSEKEIIELSKLIIKIENHYGFPCDIEWAKEKDKFYIVQSRPITTLRNRKVSVKEVVLEKAQKDDMAEEKKKKVNSGKEDYVKIFNRSLFLIACQNYDLGERIETAKVSPVRYSMDPVLHNLFGKGTDVYYNFSDPKQDPKQIIDYFNSHREQLLKLKEEYYSNCDELRSFISNSKHNDYQKLFDLTAKIWPLVAISNMLGDNRDNIKGVDSDLVLLYREMRKYSDGLIHNSHLRIAKIVQKIIPQKYKKYHEYLKYEEVTKGKYPSVAELRKREGGYIFHKGKLITNVTLDEYAKKNNYKFIGFKANDNVSESSVSGQTAYGGVAKGYARVIFEVKDVARVKKGDILVTSMTTPDFITAMKRASAFVTDEGGVTCHASIVAREIKKPCIIGTKIATQVLKDGDLVEVDADKGIVRILEKTKEEEFVNFKVPSYRYFLANKYLPNVKFGSINLWKEWHCELTVDGMANVFIPEEIFSKPGKILLDLLKKGDKKLCEELYDISNALLELSDYLMVLNCSNQKTGNVSGLEKFIPKFYKRFNQALGFGYALDSGIDAYIKENNKFAKTIKSPYESFLAREEYELYEIFFKNIGNIDNLLKEHLFKWSWIKTDYRGENHLKKEDLLKRKNEILKSNPSRPKPLPRKFKKPVDLREWISLLIFVRDIRKETALLSTVLLDRYLKKTCKKRGLDYMKARFLTIEEFEKKKNEKNLPDYTKGRFEYVSPKGLTILTLNEWRKLPFNNKINLDSGTSLNGLVASSGFAKGLVRIILSSDDFFKVKRGEIVVASMTRPEFMPILKKCSAILTEQGGITCHAAIVSRELRVPCIIGIKNLLKQLRDGDLVEVDADKGIVRILEKNEDGSDAEKQEKNLNWVNLFEIPFRFSFYIELGLRIFSRQSKYKKFPGCKDDFAMYYQYNNGATSYHLREELDASGDWGLDAHRKRDFMKKYIADGTRLLTKIKRFYYKAITERDNFLKQQSIKQTFLILAKLFEESFARYKLCNDEFQIGVQKELEKWFIKNKINDANLIQELATPHKLTTIDQIELDILKIIRIIKNNKIKKVDDFTNKLALQYSAIGGGAEGGKIWDENYFKRELIQKSKKFNLVQINKEILKLEQKESEGKRRKQEIFKKIKVPLEYRIFFEQMAALAHLKFEIRICWAYLDLITENLFNVIEAKWNIPFSKLKYYDSQEIIKLLNNSKNISYGINDRRSASLFMVKNGKYSSYYGKQAIDLFKQEIKQEEKTTEEIIKGQIASAGIVRGIARIVSPLKNQEKELAKIKDGDIIITGMTRPHMIPAMKKAIAFVTDEGGITCHAAIIAREMKKPCIIATRVATKIIHNGDLVEVDADKGIVKIIQKAKK